MNVFNPHPVCDNSLRLECIHIQLAWSDKGTKKSFLWPSDWHQRRGRRRQAVRAPGPKRGLPSGKAVDGCQKNRNVSSSRCLVTHERAALWLHVHESVVCMFMVQLPMHTRTCMSMRVCQADQMPCSSLQGALISCVFTVTDTQQSEAGPAAGRAATNGTAYKGQQPEGSQLTHQPDRNTHTRTHTHTHTSDLFLPMQNQYDNQYNFQSVTSSCLQNDFTFNPVNMKNISHNTAHSIPSRMMRTIAENSKSGDAAFCFSPVIQVHPRLASLNFLNKLKVSL